ncbi:hypothetical protein HZB02_05840 [Candidatus Woesearchaeota archaeon]|nr:hypothetical protein [Candidatus Woesearchaeota archaeon]
MNLKPLEELLEESLARLRERKPAEKEKARQDRNAGRWNLFKQIGGGVYTEHSVLRMDQNKIIKNFSKYGGGGLCINRLEPEMHDNAIENNKPDQIKRVKNALN